MIICPKCGKVISYNSYFKGYICNYCDYEMRDNVKMPKKQAVRVSPGRVKRSSLKLSVVRK